VDLQYIADATDAGFYAAENWLARISVVDTTALRDTQIVQNGVELNTLRALDVTSGSLAYGSLEVGQNTGTYDATSTIRNTGNSNIDVTVAGTSTLGTPIPINSQKYATTTFAYGSCSICAVLTESAANVNVNITKPAATTSASQQDIYWGIDIPSGTPTGDLTGYNTFIAVAPPGG